jgi:hypothetical protein
VHDTRLSGFLDGTTPASSMTINVELADKTKKSEYNPAYAAWYAQDQQLLSFLLNSVSKEVLGQVAMKTSVAGVWHTILGMFASQSRARIVHLRSKLTSTRKGESTCAAYFTQMKGFTDKMAVAAKRLDDDEVICYILVGLDFEFNPFVEVFVSKTEPQTLHDLFSQLLTVEAQVEA